MATGMSSYLKYNWPSFIWAAFIFYMCMIPSGHLPKINIPNLDKIVHFTFYLVLSSLIYFGWTRQNSFPSLHNHTLLKIFIVACIYGLSIEIMQETFTTTRHFEWADEAANATGSAVACFFISKMGSRISGYKKN
jgi:hypothetical protein